MADRGRPAQGRDPAMRSSQAPRSNQVPDAGSWRSLLPGRTLKVVFAPLNIPLAERLLMAAVLQRVLPGARRDMHWNHRDTQLLVPLYKMALFWHTPEQGGWRSNWVRSWAVWRYFKDYFPVHLIKTWNLDPSHNYIFGFHPHGVLVAGAFGNFCTNYSDFELLPGFTTNLHVHPFWDPLSSLSRISDD